MAQWWERSPPTKWPGFDSRTRHHMWVEFVVDSLPCPERFFSGYFGFPLSSKTNISEFQFHLDYCQALYHELLVARVIVHALPVFDIKFTFIFTFYYENIVIFFKKKRKHILVVILTCNKQNQFRQTPECSSFKRRVYNKPNDANKVENSFCSWTSTYSCSYSHCYTFQSVSIFAPITRPGL